MNAAATKFNPVGHWFAEWEGFRSRRKLTPLASARPLAIQVAVWLIVTTISAGLTLVNFDSFQLGAYEDDAEYTVLARSIVESGQFGEIYLPGKPGVPLFPFGFPLLLAPLAWAFPGNYEALKAVSLAATVFNIGLIFWGWPWLSRSTSRWWGVAVMICYGLSPLVINHGRMVMSEPVFTTGCLVAFILTERLSRGRASYKWIILLGIAFLALCLIRSVGLVFSAGLFLDLFIALGRWALKPVLVALAAGGVALALIVVFTPIQTVDILFPIQRYTGDFYDFTQNQDIGARSRPDPPPFLVRILQRSYLHIVRELRSSIFAVGGGEREKAFFTNLGLPFLPAIIGLSIGVVVVTGILRGFWREGGSAFASVALMYLGMLVLWNWNGDRFLYPILPQLLFGFFLGVDGIARWGARVMPAFKEYRMATVAVMAAVIIVVASFVYRTLHLQPSTTHTGDLTARTEWIKANTEPEAVVMSDVPAVDFLYGKRHTVEMFRVPRTTSEDNLGPLLAYLAFHRVDYILIAPDLIWQENYAPRYSSRTMIFIDVIERLEDRGQVTLVYESLDDMIRIYQVVQ